MKSALFGGNVLGNPVGGTYLDLQPSESAAVANTAASVVRTLVNVGKVAIAAVLLYGIYRALTGGGTSEPSSSPPPPPPPPADILREKMSWNPDVGPLSSFVFARTKNREIFGVCLDEWTTVMCEGELLEIPLLFIHEIRFYQGTAGIVLIDGSRLVDVRFINPVLNFCTLAGVQTIDLDHRHARTVNLEYCGYTPPWRDPGLANEEKKILAMRNDSAFDKSPPGALTQTLSPTARTGTELLRGALPTEVQRIQKVLLQFLDAEKDAVTEILGVDLY